MNRKPFIAGNWKMHKTVGEAAVLVKELRAKLDNEKKVEVAVAPSFTALAAVREALDGSDIALAAQNMYFQDQGAFTGEVSGPQLLDIGCKYVIIGHSERRNIFGEGNELTNRKVLAALGFGLLPILCVGESLGQRKRNLTFMVIDDQLRDALVKVPREGAEKIVIAYEPVWAIGTGETATPGQAQEVHKHIRERLESKFGTDAAAVIRIQYGGSVKASNAKELLAMPDIDGCLVGGASLKADDFVAIVEAARIKGVS